MDSSSSRSKEIQRKQVDIRQEIARLRAQLAEIGQSEDAHLSKPLSPKRKHPDSTVLAPATPSPKKRKYSSNSTSLALPRDALHNSKTARRQDVSMHSALESLPTFNMSKPAPSNVISKLAALSKRSKNKSLSQDLARSTAFTEKPKPPPPSLKPCTSILTDMNINTDAGNNDVPKRDERLVLVENLEMGPYNHRPSFDDPYFDRLEPNSGIRLSSRLIPHDDMQDYLRGRYYLSPSLLYSVIRLLPDKQTYDVPVAGDWVTIAVVAERGPVKFSRAPISVGPEDAIEQNQTGVPGKSSGTRESKAKDKKEYSKPSGKKYVNIKLIDFGARSKSSTSASGGKAMIRGDAFLTLLLFEADGFDLVPRDEGGKPEKVYKGGSRGAFESMSKLKEGDVIALLNPRILKPFQRSTDTPHPTNNILALTPESASSMVVIGGSQDLGMCTAVKRDGKVCGSWCDKRVSEVCEWHLQNAVKGRRAGRAELSIGTSGMSTTAAPKRKPAYDPARQWGLKPVEPERGEATYVLSGHVVNGPGSHDVSSIYVAETMGREGQAKAKRKLANKDADAALKTLLERDKEGMKMVIKAREAAMRENEGRRSKEAAKGEMDARKKRKAGTVNLAPEDEVRPSRSSYSAKMIKALGFDPVADAGHRRASDLTCQKKLDALAAARSSRKVIKLGPRPGPRIRSGVIPPTRPRGTDKPTTNPEAKPEQRQCPPDMIDLDDV